MSKKCDTHFSQDVGDGTQNIKPQNQMSTQSYNHPVQTH